MPLLLLPLPIYLTRLKVMGGGFESPLLLCLNNDQVIVITWMESGMQVGQTGSGALTAGLAGIQRGEQKVTQAAQDVVSATTDRPVSQTSSVARPLAEQEDGRRQVEASAKVVQAAQKSLGSLIDIKV